MNLGSGVAVAHVRDSLMRFFDVNLSDNEIVSVITKTQSVSHTRFHSGYRTRHLQ